jgi:phage terminase small subunit
VNSNTKRRAGTLTEKQEVFVREYLTDLNASAAALRSGYKWGDIGRQLLTKTHVQSAIQEAQQARAERTEITADLVVQETWKNYQRCVDAGDLSAANKALELLGRHTGAFPSRHEHTGTNGGPIHSIIEFAEQGQAEDPPTDGSPAVA